MIFKIFILIALSLSGSAHSFITLSPNEICKAKGYIIREKEDYLILLNKNSKSLMKVRLKTKDNLKKYYKHKVEVSFKVQSKSDGIYTHSKLLKIDFLEPYIKLPVYKTNSSLCK